MGLLLPVCMSVRPPISEFSKTLPTDGCYCFQIQKSRKSEHFELLSRFISFANSMIYSGLRYRKIRKLQKRKLYYGVPGCAEKQVSAS